MFVSGVILFILSQSQNPVAFTSTFTSTSTAVVDGTTVTVSAQSVAQLTPAISVTNSAFPTAVSSTVDHAKSTFQSSGVPSSVQPSDPSSTIFSPTSPQHPDGLSTSVRFEEVPLLAASGLSAPPAPDDIQLTSVPGYPTEFTPSSESTSSSSDDIKVTLQSGYSTSPTSSSASTASSPGDIQEALQSGFQTSLTPSSVSTSYSTGDIQMTSVSGYPTSLTPSSGSVSSSTGYIKVTLKYGSITSSTISPSSSGDILSTLQSGYPQSITPSTVSPSSSGDVLSTLQSGYPQSIPNVPPSSIPSNELATHLGYPPTHFTSMSPTTDWTFGVMKLPATSSVSLEVHNSNESTVSSPATFKYSTTSRVCICRCRTTNPTDMGMARSASQELQHKLLLERKNVTKYILTKISAPNKRITSTYIGSVGIALVLVTMCPIIIPDAVTLCFYLIQNRK